MNKKEVLKQVNKKIDQIILKAKLAGKWTDSMKSEYKRLCKIHKELAFA